MAHEYVDADKLKATLSVQAGATYLNDDIESACEAASRGIDLACSRLRLRKFWKDDEDVERYYSTADPTLVEINDAAEVTSVLVDDDGSGAFATEWTEGTDYVLLPLNAAADGEPWTHVRVLPQSSQRFPTGWPKAVKVVGKFGWAETPPAVKEAAGLIAARLLKRKREAPFGVVGFGIDQAAALHIARTDPDVAGLLGPFGRDRRAVSFTLDS